MGFNWKKLAKAAVKLGGKIAKPILAQTPVGQAVLKGQQVLKALGSNLKAARLGKIEPLSVRAGVAKIATPLAKRTITLRPRMSDSPRGLVIAKDGPVFRSGQDLAKWERAQKKKGSRMPHKAKTNGKRGNGTPSKRKPPKGGLDLATMASQWRAAGKPGTWISWIKANQVKKAS